MSPGESLTAQRKVRICWLSSRLIDFPQGSWWLSLGVTKDELECLQGIWDRSCIPRSPQNDSSPPYRKLENGRKFQGKNWTKTWQGHGFSRIRLSSQSMDWLKRVIGEKQCPGHIYGPISKPRVPVKFSWPTKNFKSVMLPIFKKKKLDINMARTRFFSQPII